MEWDKFMDDIQKITSERLAGTKCLVTGGTGILGKPLVAGLVREGADVSVFARPTSDTTEALASGAHIVIGDIMDPQSFIPALQNAEIVFHLAEPGLRERHFMSCFHRSIQTLIDGVRNNPSFHRIVYISTAYTGSIPSSFPAEEHTPPERLIVDLHTEANRRAEQHLMKSDIPCTVLRCPMLYGPQISHFMGLIRIMRRLGPLGLPFPGNLDARWSYLHIDDFVEICIRASLMALEDSQILIACDDSRLSVRKFFDLLSEKLEIPLRFRQPPLWTLGLAAQAFSLAPPLTKISSIGEWIHFTLHDSWFSNKRLKESLDMEFAHPTVLDGMDGFAAYLKEHL